MEVTVRLDLAKVGTTVLVKSEKMKRLQPFTIQKWYPGERVVEGHLILTNEIVKLSGGLPTYKMGEEWIEMTMGKVQDKIDLLEEVQSILESFKETKKVSATVTK